MNVTAIKSHAKTIKHTIINEPNELCSANLYLIVSNEHLKSAHEGCK